MYLKYRRALFCVCYIKRKTFLSSKEEILYLILNRKLHWTGWEFPKGGIEKGETPLKTLNREVWEETGQHSSNIKKYKIRGRYKYPRRLKDRPRIKGQNYLLYSAQLSNKKVKTDAKEHSGYAWVSYNKALKMLTWPNQRKCLRAVDREISKV